MRFEHIGYGDKRENEQEGDKAQEKEAKLPRLFLLRRAKSHSLFL